METININEILSRHSKNYGVIDNNPRAIMKASEVKDAIKEIVEAVIDKCAEEAELDVDSAYNPFVSKESILNVKQQIKY